MNFGTYVKFEGPYFDMFMSTRVNFMLVVTSFRGKLCGIYGGSSHGQVVKSFSWYVERENHFGETETE